MMLLAHSGHSEAECLMVLTHGIDGPGLLLVDNAEVASCCSHICMVLALDFYFDAEHLFILPLFISELGLIWVTFFVKLPELVRVSPGPPLYQHRASVCSFPIALPARVLSMLIQWHLGPYRPIILICTESTRSCMFPAHESTMSGEVIFHEMPRSQSRTEKGYETKDS